MGILTEIELDNIKDEMKSIGGGINFIPVMEKENKTIFLDRYNEIVYFIEDDDFNKCYQKYEKNVFIGLIEELKKDNWKMI